MDKCKSCGASIVWGVTEKGRRMPLDPEPSPEWGNVERVGGDDVRVLSGATLDAARAANTRLFVSHFATCPTAAQHRKSSR